MNGQGSDIPTGIDRLNGLLAYWGMPGSASVGNAEAKTARMQTLVVGLNRAMYDASCSQLESLALTNKRLARSLRRLLRDGQRCELTAAQSRIAMSLQESQVEQTRAWADLTKTLSECYVAITRHAEGQAPAETGRPARHGPRAGKPRQASVRAASGPRELR